MEPFLDFNNVLRFSEDERIEKLYIWISYKMRRFEICSNTVKEAAAAKWKWLFLSYPDKKRKKAVVSERSSNESKQIFHNITHLQRFFSYLEMET